jgi:hypothetical protein
MAPPVAHFFRSIETAVPTGPAGSRTWSRACAGIVAVNAGIIAGGVTYLNHVLHCASTKVKGRGAPKIWKGGPVR